MKKEGQLIALIGTYSAILLVMCILGISILSKKKAEPIKELIVETVIKTEEVYIFVEHTENLPETTISEDVLFIVKEYQEKIGVFDTSGRLLSTIDIYTKTLPKTDIALLKEGIKLRSEAELHSLIEDYSS